MTAIVSITLFAPLVGLGAILLVPRVKVTAIKSLGIGFSVATFFLSLALYASFDAANPGFQFVQKIPWIGTFDVSYHVGVDGLSLLLILLTTFLTPIAMLSSWNSVQKRVKEYTIMLLLLETGMLGVFAAVDLFLFYIFWEAMLIPMYFLIGIWGGENRIYAAMKFFLYTMFGSLLMLVAIISLGVFAATQPLGHFTTDLELLYSSSPEGVGCCKQD